MEGVNREDLELRHGGRAPDLENNKEHKVREKEIRSTAEVYFPCSKRALEEREKEKKERKQEEEDEASAYDDDDTIGFF